MRIDPDKCVLCRKCVDTCPTHALRAGGEEIVVGPECVECGACVRVCPMQAARLREQLEPDVVRCECCPIKCAIRPGYAGACGRYRNVDGRLDRVSRLQEWDDVREQVGESPSHAIVTPTVTGIGAGTAYPDCRPAPHIVQTMVDGVDVVTAVTEAPFSYSSLRVRVCAEDHIGDETALVFFGDDVVGHVCTEEYGSKTIEIGGVTSLTGPSGFAAARCIVELANRQSVHLTVKRGADLELQVGSPPVINGLEARRVRIGCGSATAGLLAPYLKAAANEVIVLDHHITSVFTEHEAGRYLGTSPSGIELVFRKSTPGRYFGEKGDGWGGTPIQDPQQAIRSIDMRIAKPGMTVLVTETTGQRACMYRLATDGSLAPIELTQTASALLEAIRDNSERATVAALFVGGAGGSMRAGITKAPLKLTNAVQNRRAVITVGGAPTFVLPGTGMTFMVDVERVQPRAFSWVPTPAVVAPVEVTMLLPDYVAIGGHTHVVESMAELRTHIRKWQ